MIWKSEGGGARPLLYSYSIEHWTGYLFFSFPQTKYHRCKTKTIKKRLFSMGVYTIYSICVYGITWFNLAWFSWLTPGPKKRGKNFFWLGGWLVTMWSQSSFPWLLCKIEKREIWFGTNYLDILPQTSPDLKSKKRWCVRREPWDLFGGGWERFHSCSLFSTGSGLNFIRCLISLSCPFCLSWWFFPILYKFILSWARTNR